MTSFFWSLNSFSDVGCSGVPSAVYIGIHGPSPAGDTFFVNLPNNGAMPMGLVTDQKAKARFAMVLSAFHAKKTISLNYYNYTTCETARAEYATPTRSVIID